mmetsp:Transcript_98751/g.282295  ORF Transcript_98751/g.282295 Transcript_98751/m.282295 type:complete len:97 (+) Transcript_98751:188-478(+)
MCILTLALTLALTLTLTLVLTLHPDCFYTFLLFGLLLDLWDLWKRVKPLKGRVLRGGGELCEQALGLDLHRCTRKKTTKLRWGSVGFGGVGGFGGS